MRLPGFRSLLMRIEALADKLFVVIARKRCVDGIWVGVRDDEKNDALLDRVEAALMVIRQHDEVAYQRVCHHLRRIFIMPLAAARGSCNPISRTCSLDDRFVSGSSPEFIASTIVHEAAHAHPRMRKLGYAEPVRYRVEMVCMRRQLAFASRLPDGGGVCAEIERSLRLAPEVWSDAMMKKRKIEAAPEVLRHAEVPEWLIKITVAVLRWTLPSGR